MKRILLFLAIALVMGSCQKVKENIIENTALSFLDGTEWKVVFYQQGSTDMSAAFAAYRFRFNKNETVDALRSNVIEASGSYKGNITNKTIYANFANNASQPLPLLNATWNITQNTLSSLSANTTVGTELRQLRMEKL